MPFSLKNGDNGQLAKVDSEGRLWVDATIRTDEHLATEAGDAYIVPLSATVDTRIPPVAGSYMIVLRNDSSNRDITIEKMIASASAAGLITLRVERNPVFVVPTNATLLEPVNGNYASNKTLNATVYVWDGVGSMAGVTAGTRNLAQILGAGVTAFPLEGSLHVPPGQSIGIFATGNAAAILGLHLRAYQGFSN